MTAINSCVEEVTLEELTIVFIIIVIKALSACQIVFTSTYISVSP